MHIEKKHIGNNTYNYLKASIRLKDKVKSITIAYLGKGNMSEKELNEKIGKISQSKIDEIVNRFKNERDFNSEFLMKNQIEKLSQIKLDFKEKIEKLDSKLIDDMFRDFKTHYIYNTNSIEGNSLTLQETDLLLNHDKSPNGADLREIYDHINEKETFDYILKNNKILKINNETIIKIHSMLLNKIDNRLGGYRTHNVRVVGADFETTQSEYVITDMNILLKWYKINNKKLNPLVLCALFHEKFERIHPFYDGNGRTGRMLVNLILLQKDYPPLIVENKKRKEYYDSLSSGHKANLNEIDIDKYASLVKFFYDELICTYDKIFSKWGM